MAKITAVHDWELGRDKIGEYYGRYSANLASMSAEILIESAENFSKKGIDVRVIVEALISAGVASCIAGSSRPCSGAEHLFSHAIDHLKFGIGLHGEKMWNRFHNDSKITRTELERDYKNSEKLWCAYNCKRNWIRTKNLS